MAANSFRFSDTEIRKIPFAAKDQVYYSDTERRGLRLRVGQSKKVFCLVKRLKNGRVREITIGEFPAVTTGAARIKANELILDIAEGKDPAKAKEVEKVTSVTLREALDRYLSEKPLRPNTIEKGYRWPIEKYLGEWLDKPILEINGKMIEDRYVELTKGNTVLTTSANICFRGLRAVLNHASFAFSSDDTPIFEKNPVKRLSDRKLWAKQGVRDRILLKKELPTLYSWLLNRIRGNKELPELCVAPEYLLFVLFTGCRRNEAAGLKWVDVDFEEGILTFRETKTHGDRTIPFSPFLRVLMNRRREEVPKSVLWVFPGPGKTGHIAEPLNLIHDFLVVHKELTRFSPHDLRRTFISYGKYVAPAHAVDAIVGHKGKTVSEIHYSKHTNDMLQGAMDAVSTELLTLCKGEFDDLSILEKTFQSSFEEYF